jgi:hypothetical protein
MGIGLYGAGDICTRTSVFVGVFMLGRGGFEGDGSGFGAGRRTGPGVSGGMVGILKYLDS